MRIETKDIVVRRFELKDKADLCEYMLQRKHEKFEGYPDFDPEKVDGDIKYRCESDEFFAIEHKVSGKVIGNVYLGKRDFNSRELGYVLNRDYHRMGYAYQACGAVIEYAFGKDGVHRIYAECCPENTASWKLLEKLGMMREAFFRKNVSFHNDANGEPVYWDTLVYAKLNPNEC